MDLFHCLKPLWTCFIASEVWEHFEYNSIIDGESGCKLLNFCDDNVINLNIRSWGICKKIKCWLDIDMEIAMNYFTKLSSNLTLFWFILPSFPGDEMSIMLSSVSGCDGDEGAVST